MGDAAAKIETDEVGQGVEGEARGKRESETAPHHVILLLLFSLPLTPSSTGIAIQKTDRLHLRLLILVLSVIYERYIFIF